MSGQGARLKLPHWGGYGLETFLNSNMTFHLLTLCYGDYIPPSFDPVQFVSLLQGAKTIIKDSLMTEPVRNHNGDAPKFYSHHTYKRDVMPLTQNEPLH